ncbi:MAG TPA: NAD-dependent epimerase/dehydratase family protein [Solirubrobacteraceae bacterium]|jgi:nucleoside-diphosphate-sugar epimerase|nr:NAD-dependent epimerase/dehydratase family protein [Solirubrobacteraceae bacterium]
MTAGLTVAVTGARGYLGRALVEALARDERVGSVVAIDVHPPRPGADTPPKARAVACDVRDPRLAEALEDTDVLVHLAWRVLGVGRDAWSVNVDGSHNAFETALGAGARTIIHASSAAAYGCSPDNPVPIPEDRPLRPVPAFYYPQTKVAVEQILDRLEQAHPEARIVRMRPVTILGPGAPIGPRIFPTLWDFDPLMQFVSMADVVRAFIAALPSGDGDAAPAGAFNLGAPGPVLSSAVAGLLGLRRVRLPYRFARAAARAGAALRLPGALNPGWVDMGRYPIVVDTARAERELGWRASGDCTAALTSFAGQRATSSTPSTSPRPSTPSTPSTPTEAAQ